MVQSHAAALEEIAALRLYTRQCLGQVRPDWALAEGRTIARKALVSYELREREGAIAAAVKHRLQADLQERGKCTHCMLQTPYCICPQLARIRCRAPASPPVRFVIWMHVKECKRASNTGKLLSSLFPDTEVLIHGCAEDESRFLELLDEARGRGFVLFPSEGAVSTADALQQGESTSSAETPLVVLLDGTWRQARRMRQGVPGALPNVALTAVTRSEFHWRRQSEEGRISTVEAAALLLDELQLADAAQALRESLAILCKGLEKQCHYDTLADLELPKPTSHKQAAVANRLPKRGPGLRGYSCPDATSGSIS